MMDTIRAAKSVELKQQDSEGSHPVDIVILPVGAETSKHGEFIVDVDAFEGINRVFRDHQTGMVIDYEHQTLGGIYSSPDGKAPAAGWISALRWEDGVGIIASVRWTAKAREMIQAEEYKYLSPVTVHDKGNKRPKALHSAALTNDPAIIGMPAVKAAKRGLNLNDKEGVKIMAEGPAETTGGDPGMLVAEIKALLGIDVENDTDVTAVLRAIRDWAKNNQGKAEGESDGEESGETEVAASARKALGLKAEAGAEEITVAINSLKQADGNQASVTKELGELKANMARRDAKDLMQPYIAAHKINPADTEDVKVCTDLAIKDPAAFAHHMERRQALVAPGRTTPPAGSTVPGAGKEGELIANSLKAHDGNHKKALVALQTKLIDEECERTGHARSRAVAVLEPQYPKIFGAE